jgi:predicted HD superfamily hydrolase involved in NAD metabolism
MTYEALIRDAENYARERLSDKRYAHTLRVAETTERLAKLHGLDPDKSRLVGLLHDTAREIGTEKLLRIAEEDGLPVGDFEREQPILLHGPVAAKLAREDLGVEDGEILDAVRIHTTGEPGMGPLALALFVADKIEPGREQGGVEDLREIAPVSLHRAARAALEDSISYNERRYHSAHPGSRQTLEWLSTYGDERPGEV